MGESMADESELPHVDLETAAKDLGMTASGINYWAKKEYMPIERIGRKIFIDPSVFKSMKVLIKEHGKGWHKYAPWIEGAKKPSKEAKKVASIKQQTENELDGNIYQNLASRALKFRRERKYEQACELYEILVASLDLAET